MSTIPMAIKWLERYQSGSGIIRKTRWVALAATVDHMWYARNKLNFDDKTHLYCVYCEKHSKRCVLSALFYFPG